MTDNNLSGPQRVGPTEPSRPGIKFVLVVVAAALIALAILVLRG